MKQLCSIGKTYLTWSGIYLIITLIQYLMNNWSLIDFVITSLLNFFIYGSYYHLWFYPTLLFITVLFTIFYRNKKLLFIASIILYLIGVIGCGYYHLFDSIPILNLLFDSIYFELIRRVFMMGLPFYMLGVNLKEFNLTKFANTKSILLMIGLFLFEMYIIHILNLYQNTTFTFSLYLLLIAVISYFINHPLENHNTIGNCCKKTSEIIYLTHPLIQLYLYNISNTLLFVISLIIYSLIFITLYSKTPSHK